MNIAIVGTGCVGLVTGACLAATGNQVICIDNNSADIADLQMGKLDFYEPGLSELITLCCHQNTLRFTTDLAAGIQDAQVVFMAIGANLSDDGQPHITDILDWVHRLLPLLPNGCILAIKSAVPPGTCDRIQALFDSNTLLSPQQAIHVVANPEFLLAGHAVASFQTPPHVVIGSSHPPAQQAMKALYAPFISAIRPVLLMDPRSAEFSKYACTAMLAARISMMNELACIAGQVEANISTVSHVLALDPRIGGLCLQPGAGYGGSHLPAQIRSLIKIAQATDEPAYMLRSLERVNHRQSRLLFETISAHFSHLLRGRCLAIWGLAFSPETDDVNKAPSLDLILALLAAGARVQAYDPVATANTEKAIGNKRLAFAPSANAACLGADALVVMTAWDEFRYPDFRLLSELLSTSALFDALNMYEPRTVRQHRLRHYRLWQKRPIQHPYFFTPKQFVSAGKLPLRT